MLNITECYRLAHFYVGNCWRYASRPWLQAVIAPHQASTIFACSFGDGGWHHLRKTLEEYDANPRIGYRETTLYRYLTNFAPDNMGFMTATIEGGGYSALPLFVYPWGTFRMGEIATSKNPWQSRFCGPSTDLFVEEEFARTLRLYKKIRQEGYHPWRYRNTFIGGTFLRRSDGSRKFIVLQGNHRMAILAHLGYQHIQVRNVPGWLFTVDMRQ